MNAGMSKFQTSPITHLEVIDYVRDFTETSGRELIRILGVIGGEEEASQLRVLTDGTRTGGIEVASIRTTVVALRNCLASAPSDVGAANACCGSDFDAALRWHGARLDELLAKLGQ